MVPAQLGSLTKPEPTFTPPRISKTKAALSMLLLQQQNTTHILRRTTSQTDPIRSLWTVFNLRTAENLHDQSVQKPEVEYFHYSVQH